MRANAARSRISKQYPACLYVPISSLQSNPRKGSSIQQVSQHLINAIILNFYRYFSIVRPTKDLEDYQDYIIELFVDKKLNYNEIASHLRRYKGEDVKGTTIKRRLKAWGVQKRYRIQDICYESGV
jgi:hypothetical protein